MIGFLAVVHRHCAGEHFLHGVQARLSGQMIDKGIPSGACAEGDGVAEKDRKITFSVVAAKMSLRS